MSEPRPTIGRIVIYHCSEDQMLTQKVNDNCNVQEHLPAIIVAVHDDDCVNLKVIQDGTMEDQWLTSVVKGDDPNEWNWPVRK